MKFMMSCRQPLVFLKEAEEIRVNYNDIEPSQEEPKKEDNGPVKLIQ